MIPRFDPLISRFDPCSAGQNSAWRVRNQKTKRGSPHPHLAKPPAKRAPSRGEKRKKRMAAKMQPKRARARSADTAAPRGRVRGKPAHATGAFPTLAPALVRRRPRQTSRRARRPSPQPCCDVDRGVSVVSMAEGPRSLQNESRRWRKWGAKFGGGASSMASRSRAWIDGRCRGDGVLVKMSGVETTVVGIHRACRSVRNSTQSIGKASGR